jgi:hypothetical protein
VATPFYILSCLTERLIHFHSPSCKVPEFCKFLLMVLNKTCLVNQISYNDRPNAELIMQSRKNADLVIRSVDLSI